MSTIVCIGASAAGAKAASRLKRLQPDAHVVMVDEAAIISYAACGIPYYISGTVVNLDALHSASPGVLRDAAYFRKRNGIDVRTLTRATAIDRMQKTVSIQDLHSGEQSTLPYDQLVLATGSLPKMPPVLGRDLDGVTTATKLEAAATIRDDCLAGRVRRVVVVGGGFIGVEMAVALSALNLDVTLVEFMPELVAGALSPALSTLVRQNCQEHGMRVLTGEKVERLEGKNNRIARVITDKREIAAEMVVFAAGFAPNTALARDAGLALEPHSQAVLVDEYMRTSDPFIYAGGDCVATRHLVTGKAVPLAMGSLANRQGRVIGDNLAGGASRFEGVVGTWIVELFGLAASGVGLSPQRAAAEGLSAVSVQVTQSDRAGYYRSGNVPLTLEMTVEKDTRRVLGVQGLCTNGLALKARIDAVAALMQGKGPLGAFVDEVSTLEVSYSPPFAAAVDVINTLANAADNLLAKQGPAAQETGGNAESAEG